MHRGRGAAAGGGVATANDLLFLELAPEQLAPGNLFDLEGRTLRFTPAETGYTVDVLPLAWDPDFGPSVAAFPAVRVELRGLRFPFADESWDAVTMNAFGSISFESDVSAFYDDTADRFRPYADLGGSMLNTVPIVSVLFRRLGGAYGFEIDLDGVNRYHAKPLADRAVFTWLVSEPYREIQSFVADPRVNRFQAVLHADGRIDLSYDEVHVEDGIVGVFVPSTSEVPLLTLSDPPEAGVPLYLDVVSVSLALVGEGTLRFRFRVRGPVPPAGDGRSAGIFYRAWIDTDEPLVNRVDFDDPEFQWYVGSFDGAAYVSGGEGVSSSFTIEGDTVTLNASVAALGGARRFAFFVDAADFEDPAGLPFDDAGPVVVDLPELTPSEMDFSALPAGGAVPASAFEAFHYPSVPSVNSLACAVTAALGDRFDCLVVYTDFRIDSQEAGAVSTGPIGTLVRNLAMSPQPAGDFCTSGRLQVIQYPSFIGSPFCAPSGRDFFGDFTGYDRQLGLLTHELGHRWLSLSEARAGARTLTIGDVHWLFGLHAPAPAPVAAAFESSPMGGAYWQANGDGSFSVLGNPFYVPATAFSYLDLYVMGLLPREDVPPFFFLDDLRRSIGDRWLATRIDLSVDDVIAVTGPRLPEFPSSQREFNLGVLGLTLPGAAPSPRLVERMTGIRAAFFDHWPRATGGASTMVSRTGDDPRFRRADVNADGLVDISDPISLLLALFAGGPETACSDADDSNDDGRRDLSDAVYTLESLFRGGLPPPAPLECGADPTADPLGCAAVSCL